MTKWIDEEKNYKNLIFFRI